MINGQKNNKQEGVLLLGIVDLDKLVITIPLTILLLVMISHLISSHELNILLKTVVDIMI